MNILPRCRVLMVIFAVLAAGCSFVSLKPQAQKVRILAAQEVKRCKPLGKVTATTMESIGFIARSPDSVAEDVRNLALNHAASMNGDSIVPATPLLYGEQSFDVYRCINP